MLAIVATALTLGSVAWAADVEGKIKAVDLRPGASVKASYQERDGQKVATSIQLVPSR